MTFAFKDRRGRDTERGWGTQVYPLLPNSECVDCVQGVSDAGQSRVTKGQQPRPSVKVPNFY